MFATMKGEDVTANHAEVRSSWADEAARQGRIEAIWQRLANALAKQELPMENGRSGRCTPDDFMFMSIDGEGVARFKNRWTRNYVYLRPDGTLIVPKGGAWRQGFYATNG